VNIETQARAPDPLPEIGGARSSQDGGKSLENGVDGIEGFLQSARDTVVTLGLITLQAPFAVHGASLGFSGGERSVQCKLEADLSGDT